MDRAFGPTSWSLLHYETLDPDALFSPTPGFVHMDGGSFQASELALFLATNITAIEEWVEDGGRLFINSAPNEGSDINFGFGGVTLLRKNSRSRDRRFRDVKQPVRGVADRFSARDRHQRDRNVILHRRNHPHDKPTEQTPAPHGQRQQLPTKKKSVFCAETR
jgi:hypothetical protein